MSGLQDASHTSSPTELKRRLEAERRGTPFLIYRDASGRQRIFPLLEDAEHLTVGRAPDADLALEWDEQVSRLHATLERVAGQWVLVDDGLSRNGSFVNGQRVPGRRRLADGDRLRLGSTEMVFRAGQTQSHGSTAAAEHPTAVSLTETQLRVLTALSRPFKEGGTFATPATNKEVAEEVFLSVDAVKGHLKTLFEKFRVEDLPQNQKRVALVERALSSGAVLERDL